MEPSVRVEFKDPCLPCSFDQKVLSSHPFFVSWNKIGSLLLQPNLKFHFLAAAKPAIGIDIC